MTGSPDLLNSHFMTGAITKRIDVVAGLIYREGRLLVCQRHMISSWPLKWEFPGGKVEAGESDVDALRRELREELGIEVQETKEIFSHTHLYPEASEVNLRFFRVDKFEGEVRNYVFQKISWVEVDDLSRLDFLAGDLPLIRELQSRDGTRLLS